jgi:hypothetical protein
MKILKSYNLFESNEKKSLITQIKKIIKYSDTWIYYFELEVYDVYGYQFVRINNIMLDIENILSCDVEKYKETDAGYNTTHDQYYSINNFSTTALNNIIYELSGKNIFKKLKITKENYSHICEIAKNSWFSYLKEEHKLLCSETYENYIKKLKVNKFNL